MTTVSRASRGGDRCVPVLDAPLYVAEADDGPRIRAAAGALGIAIEPSAPAG